ncbi:hypothetical protein ACGGZK_07705 [Agromyces sp. MMS24-K17]|uniref:COG4705 family protein n=1 Tax=Agromyces sp. MMS24-K17 TaxID=3372850 RepID=UPI003754B76D
MTTASTEHLRTVLFNRIPEVTLVFWVIKVLSTTTGETAADYLIDQVGLGLTLTALLMSAVLTIALFVQFRTRRYQPIAYWTVVVLVSIVGTLITDILTDELGVSLWLSTGVFLVLLGATFGIWYAKERTLSIHTVFTRRREAFYWLAILVTFALGTAAGDLLSETIGLGYLVSTILFSALIAAVAVAWRVFGVNSVTCFWIAYVLTRPLGASIGDLLSQPASHGGIGLGTTVTSVVFLAVIVVLVGVLTVRIRRQRAEAEGRIATSPLDQLAEPA